MVPPVLLGDQRVVTVGCYEGGKAMSISTSGVEECPILECDAEESDTRVWIVAVAIRSFCIPQTLMCTTLASLS